MATHWLKQYDTEPPLESTIETSAGLPIDLTGCTVTASMRHQWENTYTFQDQAAAVIGDPTLGNVQYIVQVGDSNAAGMHLLHWRVTFPSGRIETFPQIYFDIVWIDAAMVLV